MYLITEQHLTTLARLDQLKQAWGPAYLQVGSTVQMCIHR